MTLTGPPFRDSRLRDSSLKYSSLRPLILERHCCVFFPEIVVTNPVLRSSGTRQKSVMFTHDVELMSQRWSSLPAFELVEFAPAINHGRADLVRRSLRTLSLQLYTEVPMHLAPNAMYEGIGRLWLWRHAERHASFTYSTGPTTVPTIYR